VVLAYAAATCRTCCRGSGGGDSRQLARQDSPTAGPLASVKARKNNEGAGGTRWSRPARRDGPGSRRSGVGVSHGKDSNGQEEGNAETGALLGRLSGERVRWKERSTTLWTFTGRGGRHCMHGIGSRSCSAEGTGGEARSTSGRNNEQTARRSLCQFRTKRGTWKASSVHHCLTQGKSTLPCICLRVPSQQRETHPSTASGELMAHGSEQVLDRSPRMAETAGDGPKPNLEAGDRGWLRSMRVWSFGLSRATFIWLRLCDLLVWSSLC
jgi:hypothetical protein